MKRPDISKLEKNRNIYMKLGFVIAVSFAILAFNFTVYEIPEKMSKPEFIDEEIFDPVVRTPREVKPQLPPPSFKPSDELIPEDPNISEFPLPDTLASVISDTLVKSEPDFPRVNPDRPKTPVIKPGPPKEKLPDIFIAVEEMPRFPGCEEKKLGKEEKEACARSELLDYIYSNIKYPAIAVENTVEGTVVAQFVVELDGSISGLKIIKDIGAGCGTEVKRIVNNMPDWIPGKQRSHPVRVRFTLPVKFKLK